MSGDPDSFSLVKRGKKWKRTTPRTSDFAVHADIRACSEVKGALPSETAVAAVVTEVENAVANVRLRGSFLTLDLVSAVDKLVKVSSELEPLRHIRISSLGIGSFHRSSNARIQLAVLLEVQRALSGRYASLLISHYDPIFDELDAAVLRKVGHSVSTTCEFVGEGDADRSSSIPCIFYMIHCNVELYDKVLGKNWGPALDNICIIGNSFTWMREQRGLDTCEKAIAYINSALAKQDKGAIKSDPASSSTSTPHIDAAVASVVSDPASDDLRTATSFPRGWPLVVFEHSLGVTARDHDREYQSIYTAFDATSVHMFKWNAVERSTASSSSM